MRYTLGEEEYVEFSKQDQDKLIATNAQVATVKIVIFFMSWALFIILILLIF